ncbi:MAG: hypothetical protein LQ339_003864 [Xanthoria mediterranea]|nr:MAG: hypothetical protein LQ339_003864 [Xanthoria mediterranea]
MEAQSQRADALSVPDNLPSLSQTSPINDLTSTETTSPTTEVFPRIRKHSKADASSRQRRAAAFQAAKREVLANVQESWTWPPSADQLGKKFPRRRHSTQWRERESDTSPRPSRSPSPSQACPYKFESPDAVMSALDQGRAKRRRLMDDELKWNEGLRVFLERRDNWTGAQFQPNPSYQSGTSPDWNPTHESSSSVSSAHCPSDNLILPPATSSNHDSDISSSISVSTQSLPMSTSQSSSAPTSTRTSQSSEHIPTSSPITPTISAPTEISQTSQESPTVSARTLIPLAPPLLSPRDHPFLTPITPALYPTLYSKCIAQSLAPSFPVNLSHIVGSLVQGWKDDGEWPPKSNIQEEEGNAKGRKGSLRGKMKSLKIDIEADGPQVGLERVARRSVGKVKRALGG